MPIHPVGPSTFAPVAPSTGVALLALARRLDELVAARARLAQEVKATWEGPARARFDAERAVRDAAASELVDRCRRSAAHLAGRTAA